MPRTDANAAGIEIEFEVFGDVDDPTLLLVSGLGAQMVSWDPELCEAFVDRGFGVIRFDNRDVGLSGKVDVGDDFDVMAAILAGLAGETPEVPYLLSDMAADAMAVLDAVGVERAHVAGTSMGGMIAQQAAIDHPGRVASLTSIMSTTGDPDVGVPDASVAGTLLEAGPHEREAAIAHSIEVSRVIGSPDHFELARVRRRHELSYDRCFYPRGAGNQLAAVVASGSRSEALRGLDVPALVVHGDRDPLVTPSGGERTAEVLAGSELLVLEGMGHDLPTYFWAPVIERITALAARTASGV
jgi:pimeloyl-ACP methyl ester carboxylesterase